MAFGLGGIEMLFLLVFGGGGQTGELVSFLPADQYFKSRNLEATVPNLLELASKDPVDGKTQIAQLLALRTLGERAAEVKKADNYKDIVNRLDKIARGELAKDALGFSREHANYTLAALGEKYQNPPEASANIRDALSWFPDSATIVGAMDFAGAHAGIDAGKEIRTMWAKFMKPRDWDKVFDVVEQIGNVRLDRVAFAHAESVKGGDGAVFFRVSGRGDHKKLLEAVKKMIPGGDPAAITTTKDDKGMMISTLQEPHGPKMALIGDTDYVMAMRTGKRKKGEEAKEIDFLGQLLAVRAGKQPSALKSPLQAELNKVDARACGLLVGALPEDMRQDMMREFGGVPKTIRAEILRDRIGLEFKAHGSFANADDAKAFTKKVFELRKQGLEAMDKIPPNIPIPASTVMALKKTLESIQVQANGTSASGGMFVPGEALRSLPTWFLMGVGAEAPPPPAKNK